MAPRADVRLEKTGHTSNLSPDVRVSLSKPRFQDLLLCSGRRDMQPAERESIVRGTPGDRCDGARRKLCSGRADGSLGNTSHQGQFVKQEISAVPMGKQDEERRARDQL